MRFSDPLVLKFVIDRETIDEYNQIYFNIHKRARKPPFKTPIHPSVNEWKTWCYQEYNKHKEHWNELVRMILTSYNYNHETLQKAIVKFKYYFKDARKRDASNYVGKFLEDALVENGVIFDDNYDVIGQPIIEFYKDRDNPRMEVYVYEVR